MKVRQKQQLNLLAYFLLAFPLLLLRDKSIEIIVDGRNIGYTVSSSSSSSRWRSTGTNIGTGTGTGSRSAFVRKIQLQELVPLKLKLRGGSSSTADKDESNTTTTTTAPPGPKSKSLCKRYARIGLVDLASPLTHSHDDTDTVEGSESKKKNGSDDDVITIPPFLTSTTTASAAVTTTTTTTTDVSRSAFTSLLHKWIEQHLGLVDTSSGEAARRDTCMDIATICALPISSNNYDKEYSQNQKVLYVQKGKWTMNDDNDDNINTSPSTLQKKEFCVIVETMGCLVDSIIVLYDVKFEYRHSAIVSLLKGVQRQQRSRKKSDGSGRDGDGGGDSGTTAATSMGAPRGVDLIFLPRSERAFIELDGMKDVLMDDSYGPIGSIYIMPVIATNDDDDINEVIIGKCIQDIVDKVSSIDDDKVVESAVHIDAFRKLVQNVYSRLSGKKNDENKRVDLVFNAIQIEEGESQDNQLDSRTSSYEQKTEGGEFDSHADADSLPSISDKYDDDNMVEVSQLEDEGKEEIIQVTEKQTIQEELISLDDTEQSESSTTKDRTVLDSLLVQRSNEIIQKAETLIYELEQEQDEILLEPETKMPILHFGKTADDILRSTFYGFDGKDLLKVVEDTEDSEMLEVKRKETLSIVNTGIHRLFETQLQSLREYYGRRYENILNELEEKSTKDWSEVDGVQLKEMREKQNAILTEAAKRSTEGFRVAAQNAVPFIFRQELKDLGQMYVFDSVLDGLIRDMMHATSSSQVLEEEWASVNAIDDGESDDTSSETKKRRGPIRWYEKLAARALVLGVNYLQGWLAWQGIRKAAADRDKNMPKFPLF